MKDKDKHQRKDVERVVKMKKSKLMKKLKVSDIENHECYLCGSKGYEVVYKYDKPDRYTEKISPRNRTYCRELRVCKSCSHVFNVQNVKGVEKVYENFWSENLHGESPEKLFYKIASLPPHKSENFGRIVWLKRHLKQIGDAFDVLKGRSKKVLDIGCGLGIFLNGFLDNEWKGFGIEPSPYACNTIKEKLGLPIVCGNYNSGLFNEKFDLVTLIHVLEHIAEPVEFLKEIRKDLKPKGIVFIESPDVIELKYSSEDHEAFASEHYHVFSIGSLLVTIERAGFLPIVLEREMSPIARRRIKVLAIMDSSSNSDKIEYNGSYRRIMRFRDGYLKGHSGVNKLKAN